MARVRYVKVGEGVDYAHGGNHRQPHPTPKKPRTVKIYGAVDTGKVYPERSTKRGG